MKVIKGVLFFLSVPLIVFANMREVVCYCPIEVKTAPVIDGVLNDPCWQNVSIFTDTYEYFKPVPGAGKLKNTIQIVYNEHGLYLGIVNYDLNTAKLRKTITNRDNPNLWTDDCAEIYFDSEASGIGHRKFVVNAIGTVADLLQIDGAVTRTDWDATNSLIKTKINKDNWVIEAYFPWSDLGKRAKPGDVWQFCHVRYAYTNGSFIGTTSSPGGNYASTGNFGFLYFSKTDKSITDEIIFQKLAPKLSPPWWIGVGKNVIYNSGKEMQCGSLKQLINENNLRFENAFRDLSIPKKFIAEKEKLFDQRTKLLKNSPSIRVYRLLSNLTDNAENLRWKILLHNRYN